jgi:hypothetical protein
MTHLDPRQSSHICRYTTAMRCVSALGVSFAASRKQASSSLPKHTYPNLHSGFEIKELLPCSDMFSFSELSP